jgi:acetyl esterase/lipase
MARCMRMAIIFLIVLAPEGGLMADPTRRDIVYATVDQGPLMLDLYLPEDPVQPETHHLHPLIIWVHGGAWRMGSRKDVPLLALREKGFAAASVDYRLSTTARFPAQIHDLKAAIRHLRRHAAEYGLDPNRFAIAGASAGGHLAALAGLARDDSFPEGKADGTAAVSSDVRAIVSFFGASNLQTILSQSTRHGLSVRVPALELFLGGQPDALPGPAEQASPVTHVTSRSPPLMLLHGDQDPQMPFAQSLELQAVYQKAGVPVVLTVVRGGGHGGPEFFSEQRMKEVAEFLYRYLDITQGPG